MAAKPCPTCDGCGKLASDNKQPWTQFKGLPFNSEKMKGVRSGEVTPVLCAGCEGSGFEPQKPLEAKK